jgi:hypothetical protein
MEGAPAARDSARIQPGARRLNSAFWPLTLDSRPTRRALSRRLLVLGPRSCRSTLLLRWTQLKQPATRCLSPFEQLDRVQIIASTATDAETVRGYVEAFSDAGCDELFLFPCSPDPHQADLLSDAAL